MAIEVNGNYKNYSNDYLERVQAELDETKEVKKEEISVPKDAYISSEKSGNKPSGLYHLGRDENGKPKVLYDDPKVSKKKENCTTNTDSVDRGIEKLKEEKKQLEQQIKAAGGKEEKIKELKKQLQQVEGELNQKNNDIYRRQNAVIS